MAATAVLTDDALAAEVEHFLAEDPEVNIGDLRVDAVDGVVRISGVSASLREVRRAETLAAQVPGVRAVENLMAVESAQPPSDRELQETARAATDSNVEVEVADGVAILRGEVERPEELDTVIHALEQVPGLKELRSEVTFTTRAADAADLHPMLEQALRAAYPVPGAIRVAALHEGVVTLEGRVSSSEQRDRVLDCVRELPGVRRVENHIRIRPNKPESEQGRHHSGGEW